MSLGGLFCVIKVMQTGNLARHNQAQFDALRQLEDREVYYFGIEVGHDPRGNEREMEIVRIRVANIVCSGYGAYLRAQISGSFS